MIRLRSSSGKRRNTECGTAVRPCACAVYAARTASSTASSAPSRTRDTSSPDSTSMRPPQVYPEPDGAGTPAAGKNEQTNRPTDAAGCSLTCRPPRGHPEGTARQQRKYPDDYAGGPSDHREHRRLRGARVGGAVLLPEVPDGVHPGPRQRAVRRERADVPRLLL